jgi:hypothetical protein
MLVQQLCGKQVHTNWQTAIGEIGKDVEQLERED